MAEQDAWLLNPDGTVDPFAGNVDFSSHPDDLRDPDEPLSLNDPVLSPLPNLNPEIIPTPEPPVRAPEPEPDTPEVLDLEDGTRLTLEKEKGQWKGTIAGGAGRPQVFWGKTKNELILNTLKAQANATKKIREQNTKLKLEGSVPAQQPVAPPPNPENRELTADEIFEIKTQLDSNPALALDNLFQKQTGLTVRELVSLVKNTKQDALEGKQANIELRADSVNRAFRAANPDFYPDAGFKNFELMLKWMAKFKLNKIVKDNNVDPVFIELVATGNYTVENLEEAFTDLSDDGLLIQAPQQNLPSTAVTPPPVVVQQQEPVQPAPRPDSRIVRQETRPRAAMGLRTSDVTPVATPVEPKAPSADDLDNMSDDEHTRLWNAIRRARALSRRSQ